MLPDMVSRKVFALSTLKAVLYDRRQMYEGMEKVYEAVLGSIDEEGIIDAANRLSKTLRDIPNRNPARTIVDDLIELGNLTGLEVNDSAIKKMGMLRVMKETRQSIVEMLNVLLRVDVSVDVPDTVALCDLIREHIGLLERDGGDAKGDARLELRFWSLMLDSLM